MSVFLKYLMGNSLLMAFVSDSDLKSLDIYDSLRVEIYTVDNDPGKLIRVYNVEILDGIFCKEIKYVTKDYGFSISFYSYGHKLFDEADYYFDSENNDTITRQMDKLYLDFKGKRKFLDKYDTMNVRISVNKEGPLTSTYLAFMRPDYGN